MKRSQILTGVLVALLAVCVEAFGQALDVTEAVCALNHEVPSVLEKFTVPLGAQHRKEVVWRKTAPGDFHAVLALMQVVSVAPCPMEGSQEARLTIRAIRLIERDSTGSETVVSAVTDFRKKNATVRFDGALFPRIPKWYEGAASRPVAGMLGMDDQALVIDLGPSPRTIYHGWTEPKVTAKPGMNYLVEMEVRISGQARLQMGIDYWRETTAAFNVFDGTCQKSNNCEGYLSRWFGPTDGFVTIRVPDALTK